MKNDMIRKSVVIIVCLSLAMFAACNMIDAARAAEPSEPHPANAIWTEPSTETIDNTTITPGYKFNVTVWLNVTDDIFAWQTKLLFNTTYFEAVKTGYTGNGQSDFFAGHTTMPVTPIIDNVTGFVLSGESLLGADSETGYGSLIWVEFNLTKVPPQNHLAVNFTGIKDTFILGTELTKLTLDIVNGTDIPVIPEFTHMIILLMITAFSTVPVILTKKFKR